MSHQTPCPSGNRLSLAYTPPDGKLTPLRYCAPSSRVAERLGRTLEAGGVEATRVLAFLITKTEFTAEQLDEPETHEACGGDPRKFTIERIRYQATRTA